MHWCRGVNSTKALLYRIFGQLEVMMATIDDLVADVAAEASVEASILALLVGIAQQLKDLQGTVDPTAAAKIDALHAQLTSNIANLQAAVTANTPVV